MTRRTQSFRLEGVEELVRRMEILGPELSTRAGATATRKAAKVIEKAAVANAPVGDADTSRKYTIVGGGETRTVDYGHLFENIRTKKTRAKKAHMVVYTVSTSRAFWGHMLEFGTVNMAALPWFRPAIDASAAEAYQTMMAELKAALDRALRRTGRL